MNSTDKIIKDLKNKGFRVTRTRTELVDVFLSSPKPLSVPEILLQFQKKEINVNKTTIYRELAFLLEQDLVHQVDLRERGKKYEYNHDSHHHHLICIKCKNVEDFNLEQDLYIQEKKIKEQSDFTVLNHSLEFFGLCKSCNTSKDKMSSK